jgi:glycosyltransferase involved in cell wall biosynthesis
MNTPRISIGLPVYNGEKYLRQTIELLLAEQSVDLELIISDNCSTDKTQEICQEYVIKDKRVKYFRNKINMGPIWNFNNIFQLTSGEYFMWACHDDIFPASYLRVCVDTLDANPQCVLVGAYTQSVFEGTEEVSFVDQGLTTSGSPLKRFMMLKKVMYGGSFVNGIFYGVYRSEVMKKLLPLYDLINPDQLHLLRVVLEGDIITIPEPLLIKRKGGTSQSYANIARVCNVKNPLFKYCPYFTLECILQKYILSAQQIPLVERVQISLFSFAYYFYTYLRFLYWCIQGKERLLEKK